MKIIKITNKSQLDEFAAAQEHSPFHQSWEWGEFQQAIAGEIFRMGVENEGKIIAVATLIKKRLPMLGRYYFYCPRGPLTRNVERVTHNEIIKALFNEIGIILKKKDVFFYALSRIIL